MKDAGYASMFIGKYLNRNVFLTPEQWQAHDAGWTQLDVFKGINGYFNNYTLHTKTGDLEFGKYHSTQMVADRAVHAPARDAGRTSRSSRCCRSTTCTVRTRRCRNSAAIRAAPTCRPGSRPTTTRQTSPTSRSRFRHCRSCPTPPAGRWFAYCEELLGIDKAVGQVTDELEADGRLDNTLLVFTADNGVAWGAHRLGQEKLYPYTTPVPAVHVLAGALGRSRYVDGARLEHRPGADLLRARRDVRADGLPARTDAPDGVSLVRCSTAMTPNLGRQAVLEESYAPFRNSWTALRTTPPLSGRSVALRRVFDRRARAVRPEPPTRDELHNLADVRRANAALLTDLDERLEDLRNEGLTEQRGSIRIVQSTVPADEQEFEYTRRPRLVHPARPRFRHRRAEARSRSSSPTSPTGATRFTQADVRRLGADRDRLCTEEASVTDVTTGTADDRPTAESRSWCAHSINAVTSSPMRVSRYSALGPFKADGLYSAAAASISQTVKRKNAQRREIYDFFVMIQNDGGQTDLFKVRGVSTGSIADLGRLPRSRPSSPARCPRARTPSPTSPRAQRHILGIRVTVGARAQHRRHEDCRPDGPSVARPSAGRRRPRRHQAMRSDARRAVCWSSWAESVCSRVAGLTALPVHGQLPRLRERGQQAQYRGLHARRHGRSRRSAVERPAHDAHAVRQLCRQRRAFFERHQPKRRCAVQRGQLS